MIKNSIGFTLVEVMVTVAVLGTALYALATLATDLEKSPAYAEAQVNIAAISSIARETLRYQTTCQAALVGPIGPQQEIQLKIPGILGDNNPANDVLSKGATLQKLKVTGLHFVNTVDISPTKHYSEVQLEAQMISNGFQLHHWIVGGVFYSTDAAFTQVTGCTSSTVNPVSLCQQMGCTWNINQTPACQCTPIDLSCPPQEFLVGYNSSLNPPKQCKGLGNGQCPPGTYLRGVYIGGNDCVPLAGISSANSAIDGSCGSPPNGGSFVNAGAANAAGPLCSQGTASPSSLSGAGPWSWSCNGSNGGLNASCSASVAGSSGCAIAGTSTTGAGACAPAAGTNCRCSGAGETWNGSQCVPPTCTCTDPTGYWVPCAGGVVTGNTCDVSAVQHTFPLPAVGCTFGTGLSCAYTPPPAPASCP